jgi:hypothetical protein
MATQSKYLAEALRQLSAPRRDNPQSWAEALARVGTGYFAGQGLEKIEAAASEKAKALAQALFPNDPKGAALLEANPDAITGALAKGYEPTTISEGQYRLGPTGQPQFVAPKTGIDDGRGYVLGPQGMQSLGELAPSFGQQTARMGQEETGRHNLATEDLGQGQLAVSQGNLGVAQGQLGLNQQIHQARQASGGYGTPGVGQVLGPQLGQGWEVIP